MVFRLIDKDWHKEFEKSSKAAQQGAFIITPFLQKAVIVKLLGDKPKEVKVITRFNLDDFLCRVSDINALQYLLDIGAEIKGIKHLHAKVYIFGNSTAIVTSANLTQAALYRNTEFGMQSDEAAYIQDVKGYFDSLWKQADTPLTSKLLKIWRLQVDDARKRNASNINNVRLGDKGTDIGLHETESTDLPEAIRQLLPHQYFVKFFSIGSNRAERAMTIHESVKQSHCHLYLSYPKDKRPRQVQNGDIIYCGRLVKKPNDIMIYGRVRGISYDKNRDNVTNAELKKPGHGWRKDWPHYIRVYDTEFMKGTLKDSISLNELIKQLGPDTFVTTQNRALKGERNINPKMSLGQQPAVRLTPQAAQRLNELLNDAFAKHGQLSQAELKKLN